MKKILAYFMLIFVTTLPWQCCMNKKYIDKNHIPVFLNGAQCPVKIWANDSLIYDGLMIDQDSGERQHDPIKATFSIPKDSLSTKRFRLLAPDLDTTIYYDMKNVDSLIMIYYSGGEGDQAAILIIKDEHSPYAFTIM